MPKTSEMRESNFLKKEDVGRGVLATIAGCEQHNVAMKGADPDLKWCLRFRELDKPLVLNATNVQLCEQILGSDDTDDWTGHQVVLYTDPNVSYGGKLVGGIRIRAPKTNGAAVPSTRRPSAPVRPAATPDTGEMLTDEDIPF